MKLLRGSPAFAATAVVTLALGIGAATAIFSVTHAVLLRPLPYQDPERLVYATVDLKQRNVRDFPVSNADYLDLRSGATLLEDLAAVSNSGANVMPRDDGTREQLHYAMVTVNFFRLLGGRIARGRDFTEADGKPGTLATVILSDAFFRRRYGGDPAVVGRPMLGAKGGPMIAGVLAPGLELLFPADMRVERSPDMWFATQLPYDSENRLVVTNRLIGRLKPGVTLARAQAQVDALAAELRRKTSIWQTAGLQIRLEPVHRYLVAPVRPAILALMGAVVVLLLIACANVANLMLVRAHQRARELAVRSALGAGRWRLVRTMLGEALLLAAAGAAGGALLAWVAIQELLAIAPANLPRLQTASLNPAALGFAVLAALAAAALFGIAPAVRASRPDIAQVLRSAGRTAGLGSGSRLRSAAVVAQVALSFVLLTGSGLLLRSFFALDRIDRGYQSGNVLTFQMLAAPLAKAPEARGAFMRRMHDRLASIPGVQGVTAASAVPLSSGYFGPVRWGTADALADSSKFQAAEELTVLPGYFELLHVPVLEGRTFTEADNSPDRDGVIIDQFLAAKAFPHQSAVGKRILFKRRKPDPEWMQVIGVVAHQRETSLAEPGREQIFITDGFWGHRTATCWLLRTEGEPGQYAGPVREAVAQLDRGTVLTDLVPFDHYVRNAESGTRFTLVLLGVFAAMAALLAAVGLYGVLATVVRQRTAEIGIRMALGAAPASIFQLVVGQGLRLSAAGLAAGLVSAFLMTRALSSMLVGVRPNDPATYAGALLLFPLLAAAASWIPARRAARLAPASALREE